MKQTYTIKVTCDNPEFGSDTLKEGIEVNGFLLLGFEGGSPAYAALSGMSINDIADFFLKDDKVISLLRQGAVLGEAKRTAFKIEAEMAGDERKRERAFSHLQDVLAEIERKDLLGKNGFGKNGEQDREREE